ncbi:siphovirus Gp157 family protein [Brevibacillus laterosporus]|uniref:siphovirus Gp157 family protein n=1 Tax=Brevibacillus laterosporus TaxID=1465 RepID=UPI00215CC2E4|nr:siphovirus Gp157 family protein [Brevibacillus laterosporus]MCR8994720.1 siphovirus Gp157 family protein [Brevibacillus laterosporus]
MKLYELAGNYRQIVDMVENGELDFEAIKEVLESYEDALEVKVENIVKLMKSIEGEIDMFKGEEKRINERRKTLENRLDGLEKYLFSVLKANNLQKVKAGTFTVGIQKSQASVSLIDESKIPAKYRIAQPDKIDKKAIAKDINSGEVVEGASLIKTNEHLRIR